MIKTALVSFAILCLSLALPGFADAPANAAQQHLTDACRETANSYAFARDRLMYEAYGDLFTEDAVFAIGPNEVVGRAAIVQALKTRGANETTRHFITPVQFEVIDDKTAKGISYLTLYAAAGQGTAGKPLEVNGPAVVGEYHDEFRMTDQGCKFSTRRVKLVFTGTPPGQQ